MVDPLLQKNRNVHPKKNVSSNTTSNNGAAPRKGAWKTNAVTTRATANLASIASIEQQSVLVTLPLLQTAVAVFWNSTTQQ